MTATRDEKLVTLVLYLLADTYDVAGRRDIANALVLAASRVAGRVSLRIDAF